MDSGEAENYGTKVSERNIMNGRRLNKAREVTISLAC